MNPICQMCGDRVEDARTHYAIPTCFACLPPPEPLPIAPVRVRLAPQSDPNPEGEGQ